MGSYFVKIIIRIAKWIVKKLLVIALFVPVENPNHIIYDKQLLEEYDFIVVGSGAGGSPLASRLSEDHHHSVLLLEAGGAGSGFADWPLFTTLIYNVRKYDWTFHNVRDEGYCIGYKKQQCTLNRGKMLGGSTGINGMMYVRGNKNDYDQWERLGNPGWGFRDVLPYFIRSEDNQDPYLRQSPYHGVGGYLPVSSARYLSGLAGIWIQAARHLGFEIGDINGDRQIRFMNSQSTTKLGERWSAARAFLRAASRRPNLNILIHSHVTRVIIDPVSRRARGVVFYKNRRRHVVWARKEVILSAGAFASPQLLKLSGVGPCAELRKHGIPCIHDLPGVGENMQSHFGIGGIDFLTKKKPGLTLAHFINLKSLHNYVKHRTGPLASYLLLEGTGFAHSGVDNTSVSSDWPDLQFLFYPLHLATDGGLLFRIILGMSEKLWIKRFKPAKFKPGYRIVPVMLHPRSRGRVVLRSRNPWQHPDIFLNLFDDPRDLAVLREGGRLAERLGLSAPFRRVGGRLQPAPNPYCHLHPRGGPDWWDCSIRVFAETIWHETSTCAMGPASDPAAVVDNQLRVYGISGLRVVDASVMPRITSGNTMAPTIMIGEKAADLIRAHWHAVSLGRDPEHFVESYALHPHRHGLYTPQGAHLDTEEVLADDWWERKGSFETVQQEAAVSETSWDVYGPSEMSQDKNIPSAVTLEQEGAFTAATLEQEGALSDLSQENAFSAAHPKQEEAPSGAALGQEVDPSTTFTNQEAVLLAASQDQEDALPAVPQEQGGTHLSAEMVSGEERQQQLQPQQQLQKLDWLHGQPYDHLSENPPDEDQDEQKLRQIERLLQLDVREEDVRQTEFGRLGAVIDRLHQRLEALQG
ncbi:glucose dehydrogenase [FAD, quinone]-like [Amphibalanus amphitrite]|uniref:glucose dehydrogenase [FAD, quinone]-like n=1 Tax=Amphibalanus amphitrite TaxID=1232801 RepID=UPI001C92160E|nr:glucose dehydrogenase [FAD, quinone]-like [Amphibalanus amphitrite]